jgi:hypothetical protein
LSDVCFFLVLVLYRTFLYLDENAIRSTRGIHDHPVRMPWIDQRATLTTFLSRSSMARIEAAEIYCADSNGFSELLSGLGIPLSQNAGGRLHIPSYCLDCNTAALPITWQAAEKFGATLRIMAISRNYQAL